MMKFLWLLVLMLGATISAVDASPIKASNELAQNSTPSARDVAGLQLAQAPPEERRPRQRLGIRGGVCAISPGLLEPENVIWSDRPLFLWRSDPGSIDVQRLELTDAEGRILWEKPLESNAGVIYDGPSLASGQFYRWELIWIDHTGENSVDYTFQVMEPEKRNQINTALSQLTGLRQASSLDAESLALLQADYFAQLELWSDALRVLYTVEQPSLETTQRVEDWMNSVCGEYFPS